MSSSWSKVLSSSAAMSSIYFSNPRNEITGGWEKCSAALTFCRARGNFDLGERTEGRGCAQYGSRRLGERGERREAARSAAARRAGSLDELFEHLVGLGADDAVAAGDKSRDAGHAVLRRFRPIGIDRLLEAAIGEDGARFIGRQANRCRELDQEIGIADVARLDEVGLVERVM